MRSRYAPFLPTDIAPTIILEPPAASKDLWPQSTIGKPALAMAKKTNGVRADFCCDGRMGWPGLRLPATHWGGFRVGIYPLRPTKSPWEPGDERLRPCCCRGLSRGEPGSFGGPLALSRVIARHFVHRVGRRPAYLLASPLSKAELGSPPTYVRSFKPPANTLGRNYRSVSRSFVSA
jgi:hypothetical protein